MFRQHGGLNRDQGRIFDVLIVYLIAFNDHSEGDFLVSRANPELLCAAK